MIFGNKKCFSHEKPIVKYITSLGLLVFFLTVGFNHEILLSDPSITQKIVAYNCHKNFVDVMPPSKL